MNLAYIISAYQHAEHLSRLVRRLYDPGASFFIHVDKKTDRRVFSEMLESLGTVPRVRFLKRHTCYWGGFGHVAATLEGIGDILATGTRFDYAVLLTGQDYPIKPNSYIKAFLAAHEGKLFLHYFPLPIEAWSDGRRSGGLERIEAWHWRVAGRHLRFPPSQRLPLRRRFPAGFRPFGGSSYWCLSGDCIRYIHEFVLQHPSFVRFFRHVDIPDEMFFQTIILNSRFGAMAVNDDLRHINWSVPDLGRPSLLRRGDFGSLADSRKLFARKFDARIDAEVLELIDQHLLEVG
jgi:Core-2/I-Branching enzyme